MPKFAALTLLLPVLLAACGSGQPQARGETVAITEASGAASGSASGEPAALPTEPGVTAIDAALGDGRAMPDDWHGPSPYELAQKKAADQSRLATTTTRAARSATQAPPSGAAAADLLDADETVTIRG